MLRPGVRAQLTGALRGDGGDDLPRALVVPIETSEVPFAFKLAESVVESLDVAVAPNVPVCCSLGFDSPLGCLPSSTVGKQLSVALSVQASHATAVNGHRAVAFYLRVIPHRALCRSPACRRAYARIRASRSRWGENSFDAVSAHASSTAARGHRGHVD
jgi:hypothetical protein